MGGWGEVGLDLIQGTHIGRALKEHQLEKQNQRDLQAQSLGQQAQKIADNVVSQFGPQLDPGKELTIENLSQVPGAKPYIDQLQQITQQHNALFQPHEAPLLVRSIEKFFGRTPKTSPAQNQMTAEGELLEAPVARSGAEDQEYLRKLNELKNDKTLSEDERLQYMTSLRRNRYHMPETSGKDAAEHDIPGDAIYAHLDAQGQAIKDAFGNDIHKEWLYTQSADGKFYPKTTQSAEKEKPFEPKFNSVTGTVYEISNGTPDGTYDASNITTAPPAVQAQWKALKTDVAAATTAKDAEEEKRNQQSLDKQQLGFDEREKLAKQTQAKQEYSRAQTAATRAKTYISARNSIQNKLTAKKTALSKMSGLGQGISDLIGSVDSNLPGSGAFLQKEALTNEVSSLETQLQQADTMANGQLAAYEAAYGAAEDSGANTAGLPDPQALRGEGGGGPPDVNQKAVEKNDPLGIL